VTTSFTLDEEVTHPKFGDGTITDIESNKLTIKFSDGRVKQILDYYVKRRAR
jgi:DNA helicase-2/ATP-dependent DNA helicase PcrA